MSTVEFKDVIWNQDSMTLPDKEREFSLSYLNVTYIGTDKEDCSTVYSITNRNSGEFLLHLKVFPREAKIFKGLLNCW